MVKQKFYSVYWNEGHSVIVKAKNQDEAIEKANEGEYCSDESSEITDGFTAIEVCNKCQFQKRTINHKVNCKK